MSADLLLGDRKPSVTFPDFGPSWIDIGVRARRAMVDADLIRKKLAFVRNVVEHRLDDLIAFSAVVRGRLGPD